MDLLETKWATGVWNLDADIYGAYDSIFFVFNLYNTGTWHHFNLIHLFKTFQVITCIKTVQNSNTSLIFVIRYHVDFRYIWRYSYNINSFLFFFFLFLSEKYSYGRVALGGWMLVCLNKAVDEQLRQSNKRYHIDLMDILIAVTSAVAENLETHLSEDNFRRKCTVVFEHCLHKELYFSSNLI